MDFEHVDELADGVTSTPPGGNFTAMDDYLATRAAVDYVAAEQATMALVPGPNGQPIWVNQVTSIPATPAQHAVSGTVHRFLALQQIRAWAAAIGIILALLTVFAHGLLPRLAEIITWPFQQL